MSTRELVDAIVAGDATTIQTAFESAIADRIANRLDTMRQEVAKGMFKEAVEAGEEEEEEDEDETEDELEEAAAPGSTAPAKVHPNAIHVQHVGGGKYKVHAVGKNWSGDADGGGIKAGEHLSDSELDDAQEMGARIKHVK